MEFSSLREETLQKFWKQYELKPTREQLMNYVQHFVRVYHECIDTQFIHLEQGRYGYVPEGPHRKNLPDDVLTAVAICLSDFASSSKWVQDNVQLHYVHKIVQFIIIFVRNPMNIEELTQQQLKHLLIKIANVLLAQISSEGNNAFSRLILSILETVLHVFECIYDPYFIWRKQLKGWDVDKQQTRYEAAIISVEVIPFIYECFQYDELAVTIKEHLIHVFGAIITGRQDNALKAICPATVDVLLKVMQQSSVEICAEQNKQIQLKQLVLKCLVKVIQVLHSSSPEKRQVEVGVVVERYFHSMLCCQQEVPNLQFQLTTLGVIEEILRTDQKHSLQIILVAEGLFDTFVDMFHKMTITGSEAQDLAIAILKVLKLVIVGCPIAKQQFKEKIGCTKFVEALKSLGQPSQQLLNSLLELALEDTYQTGHCKLSHAHSVLILVQWLPDIQCHDLQYWLSKSLKEICCCKRHNLMQCCEEGVIGAIINVLKREKQISEKAVLNLISILEELGKFSMTPVELKAFVRLFKPEKSSEICKYTRRLLHAMSVMSCRSNAISPLHYIDLSDKDAGIYSHEIGKWPGQGFTFHVWLCLDNDSTCLEFVRQQLYCIKNGSGSGFESFFIKDGVLVVAVIIRKEIYTVAVPEIPFKDGQWHCITIVHSTGKGPFGQSCVTVYVDGIEKKAENCKFPPITESFTSCYIGMPSKSEIKEDKFVKKKKVPTATLR